MPIKPENKNRYPSNWKEIRADILKRANNCCEFCGVENYSVRANGSKVVLTIAHLDHTPEKLRLRQFESVMSKMPQQLRPTAQIGDKTKVKGDTEWEIKSQF